MTPISLLLISVLSIAPLPTVAQSNATVTTYQPPKKYTYYGCYNETTDLAGLPPNRALAGGIDEVFPNNMTVPMCLAFCDGGGANGTKYRFAGLEWSRECWCSQEISTLSAKLDNTQCNYPCAGNDTMACGGSLKLSVYELSGALKSQPCGNLFLASSVLLTMFLSLQ